MTIAELFVNLGIKGDGQAKKALGGVQSQLEQVKSTSIETKAMILAVVYGLEQLMEWSAKTGTSMMNFTRVTGISAETLQRYQYAGRQIGASNEAVENSFRKLQTVANTKLVTGEGFSGLYDISNTVEFDLKKANENMPYFIAQLQKYARIRKDATATRFLEELVDPEMLAAMRTGAFTAEQLAKAPIIKNEQLKKLNEIDVAWMNFHQTLKLIVADFSSEHGLQIVQDFGEMAVSVGKLVSSLTTLADKLYVFKLIEFSLKGLVMLSDLLVESVDKWSGAMEYKSPDTKKEGAWEFYKDAWKNAYEDYIGMPMKSIGSDMPETKEQSQVYKFARPNIKNPQPRVGSTERAQNVIVNQYGIPNTHSAVDEFKQSMGKAGRASTAIAKGR